MLGKVLQTKYWILQNLKKLFNGNGSVFYTGQWVIAALCLFLDKRSAAREPFSMTFSQNTVFKIYIISSLKVIYFLRIP